MLAVAARPNAQDVSRAAVIQSAVVPWKVAWFASLGGVLATNSLHFPQTNRILLAHVKQNGDTPSTKEVRVMSARTVLISGIDGFQMSIKRPTSGGQARTQEAAVQQIFHLERSSFFYLSALMVRTQRSVY